MRWKKNDRSRKVITQIAALIMCAVILTGTAGCAQKKEQASAPVVETSEEANIGSRKKWANPHSQMAK